MAILQSERSSTLIGSKKPKKPVSLCHGKVVFLGRVALF